MEMMLTIDFAADMMPAWSWHVLARHKKEPVGGGDESQKHRSAVVTGLGSRAQK